MIKMSDKKINSLHDIEQLRDRLLTTHKDQKARILVCMTGCRALGAKDVASEFKEQLKAASLEDSVAIVETGCIGIC